MRRPTRVRELLSFDLALRAGRIPGACDEARPSGAPSLFPSRMSLVGFDEAGRGALAGPVAVGCVEVPGELLDDPERASALLAAVDDSKRLTPGARERAFAAVDACARWAVGLASAAEIDLVGIVAAAELAARRAYRRLGRPADLAVFDRGLSMGQRVCLDPHSLSSLGRLSPMSSEKGEDGEEDGRVLSRESRPPCRLHEPYGLNGLNESPSGFPPGVAFTRGDTRSLHVAAASLVAKVTRDHLLERLELAFRGYELARHKGYGTQRHRDLIAQRGPSPVHRLTFLRATDGAKSQSC